MFNAGFNILKRKKEKKKKFKGPKLWHIFLRFKISMAVKKTPSKIHKLKSETENLNKISLLSTFLETIFCFCAASLHGPKNESEWGRVVVAQLAERLLPILEIRGSNPKIANKVFWISVNCNSENTKIKKKELTWNRFRPRQGKICFCANCEKCGCGGGEVVRALPHIQENSSSNPPSDKAFSYFLPSFVECP